MSPLPPLRLLIVDDDPDTAEALTYLATESGYAVTRAQNGRAALALVDQEPPDAVLTDLHMPELDGHALLGELMRIDPTLPVIVITGYPEIAKAVEAMQAGAVDFVIKPADWSVIEDTLRGALRRRALRAEASPAITSLRERLGLGLGPLIGVSPAMAQLFALARRAAPSQATVLLTGESGTGKGELAACIHQLSPRCDGPFVALHCAAITQSLVESELFGHEMGAFTGATQRRVGRFEQAHGGTLFIDEVAEIPMATQTKLLRVLQDRTIERVGGQQTLEVDVRLVAATNADLVACVEDGTFREDLYYRLNVIRIEMPPLRERREDILPLTQHFLSHHAAANARPVSTLSDAAAEKLRRHDWPGNVRQLRNAIERAVVLCRSERIEDADLDILETAPNGLAIPGATMKEIELTAIRTTFLATGRCTKRTAEVLGMAERTLQYRLRELGLARRRGRPSKSERPPEPS